MKIGVLEDNPAILDLIQTTLKMAGHSVCTYIQGQTLLVALFGDSGTQGNPHVPLPYDLLIVDLNLPGALSGLDVITAIYRRLTPEILPIIVVSAGSLHDLEQVHRSFPMLPIIRKPFTLQTLLQQVNSLHAVT